MQDQERELLRGNRTDAVLIVNGQSRRGRDWYPLVEETLEKSSINIGQKYLERRPANLADRVKKAIAEKAPMVIVGGGDGTFSNIARYFVNSESVLGVLPMGTGNAFARDLGIAASVPEACMVLVEGRVQPVDLGVIEDDYFLNVSTVGLTTLIAQQLTTEAKRRLGRMVYLFALMKGISTLKPFHAVVETPEGKAEFDSLQVVIGNGRFHAGPFPVAPDASITEGKLSVYALMGRRKSQFIKLAWYLRTGRHVDLSEVFHVDTTGGILTTTPSRKVIVDGEIQFTTPVKFGVAPDVLKVMVPQDFRG